jgi:hypothetical protein
MSVPEVPAKMVASVPVGPSSVTDDDEIVTLERRRLTRCPAAPVKCSTAVSPDEVVVIVTGGPPGLIGYACRAVPVTVRVVEPPAPVAVTESVTDPRSLGVYVPLYRPSPRAASATFAPFAVAVTVTPPLLAHIVPITESVIGVPTSTAKPGPGESTHACGVALHATAAPMFRRPPLAVTPASAGS